MPTRLEIQSETHKLAAEASDSVRRRYLKNLSAKTGRTTIVYASAFGMPKYGHVQNALSISLQDIQAFMAACVDTTGPNLDLILHSPGGSPEAAEQIVNYLRAKFTHIRAIVPQSAMSAATMIACACDEIMMGKHSAIGPIDPQVMLPRPTGGLFLPAQSFLDEFKKATIDIQANPASAAIWLDKMRELPPGFLTHCDKLIGGAKTTVERWLSQYMKLDPIKAAEVAGWLGTSSNHFSHGRPISCKDAGDRGLKVTELEADSELQDLVLSVYHSIIVTFEMTPCGKLVENNSGKGLFFQFQPPQMR